MTVKIALRLSGLDLREPSAYERLENLDLGDLFFEANDGVSLAVLFTDDVDPEWVVTDAARRIAKLLPGVTVAAVHDELVSTADIAARCTVAPEAVRLWAAGKRRSTLRRFPAPRQVVGAASGGKTMSLWAWRDVLDWVREVIGIDPDEDVTYLDDTALACLNADLTSNRTWVGVDAMTQRVSSTNDAGSGAVGSWATAVAVASLLVDNVDPQRPLVAPALACR
jgi:hypothetical protein